MEKDGEDIIEEDQRQPSDEIDIEECQEEDGEERRQANMETGSGSGSRSGS